MTKTQGWLIIAALVAISAFLAWQHIDAQPNQATRAVTEHYRLMCGITGDANSCAEYQRRMDGR